MFYKGLCITALIASVTLNVITLQHYGVTTYDNVENSFRSWMGAFYKLLTKIQRKNMIKLYEDLFNKHIEIVNKKMVITD